MFVLSWLTCHIWLVSDSYGATVLLMTVILVYMGRFMRLLTVGAVDVMKYARSLNMFNFFDSMAAMSLLMCILDGSNEVRISLTCIFDYIDLLCHAYPDMYMYISRYAT